MAYDPTYPADDIYVKDLPAAIRQKGEDIRGASDATPVGVVLSFAGNVAPGGYLLCDGQAVSRETYSALFAVVGVTFGAGNGSTTFNVPDLRGEFIRGLDGGRGVDSGRTLGSAQSSANLSHAHTVSGSPMYALAQGVSGIILYPNEAPYASRAFIESITHTTQPVSGGLSLNNSGGTEARPRNIALNFIIKA